MYLFLIAMPDELVVRDVPKDDAWFAARMTNVQFEALACRMDPHRIQSDLRSTIRVRRPRRGRTCDETEVARWLVNGWSTEQLLKINSEQLVGEALRHSLHWAFPQAYYSAFAVTLAYFKAVGYTETSHNSVIRKFGIQADADSYPQTVACTASGAKPIVFQNLSPCELDTSLTFSPDSPQLVDAQVAQFLRATRDLDLREKKGDLRILTARGARKKSFNASDWSTVATALGPTSVLGLLYRKRIKANYRDIDSFLHEEIDAEAIYRNLLRIVGALNFVHEVYLACMITCDAVEGIIARIPITMAHRAQARLAHIRELLA